MGPSSLKMSVTRLGATPGKYCTHSKPHIGGDRSVVQQGPQEADGSGWHQAQLAIIDNRILHFDFLHFSKCQNFNLCRRQVILSGGLCNRKV